MTTDDIASMLAFRRKDERLLAWLRLVRVLKKAKPLVRAPMEGKGLTGAQLEVLVHVGLREGSNQQECATRLSVTKGNITQHVARLEGRGLIRRQADGRHRRLALTDQGRALLAEVVPDHDEGVRSTLGGLTRSEVRQLSALLRKVERSLE